MVLWGMGVPTYTPVRTVSVRSVVRSVVLMTGAPMIDVL